MGELSTSIAAVQFALDFSAIPDTGSRDEGAKVDGYEVGHFSANGEIRPKITLFPFASIVTVWNRESRPFPSRPFSPGNISFANKSVETPSNLRLPNLKVDSDTGREKEVSATATRLVHSAG